MTVEEMHYEVKLKLNKIDSQNYENLIVPEIDWYLNEAQDLFIKQRYGISNSKRKGFEASQKRIDDLREIVVKGIIIPFITSSADLNSFQACLPEDYMFYIRSRIDLNKEKCGDKEAVSAVQIQHDDLNEVLNDPFYSPSFEWEEVPIVFMQGSIGENPCRDGTVIGYSDGTFILTNLRLDYLRHPLRISWGDGFDITNSYTYPNGVTAVGLQNCELAEHTHHEIVDIAVMIASGDLDHPNFQMKMLKTQLNE
jgi:hypothetical protein